jgi:hypothetical protein
MPVGGLCISVMFEIVWLRWRKMDSVKHIATENQHVIHSLIC